MGFKPRSLAGRHYALYTDRRQSLRRGLQDDLVRSFHGIKLIMLTVSGVLYRSLHQAIRCRRMACSSWLISDGRQRFVPIRLGAQRSTTETSRAPFCMAWAIYPAAGVLEVGCGVTVLIAPSWMLVSRTSDFSVASAEA